MASLIIIQAVFLSHKRFSLLEAFLSPLRIRIPSRMRLLEPTSNGGYKAFRLCPHDVVPFGVLCLPNSWLLIGRRFAGTDPAKD